MKKRGFTLVELLAVIVLLGLVCLIVFPKILETINRTNHKMTKAKLDLLYQGTERYLSKEGNAYPKLEGNTFCISPTTLANEKYIDFEELPEDGDNYVVRAVIKDDEKINYTYMVKNECVEKGVVAVNMGSVSCEIDKTGYAYRKNALIQYPSGENYQYSYSVDGGKTWKNYKNEDGTALKEVTFESNGYIIARVRRIGENAYKSCTADIKNIDKTPVGAIIPYVSTTVPKGYFKADGSVKSMKVYKELYDSIKDSYDTTAPDTTTFRLPDFNGVVPVGLDSNDSAFSNVDLKGGAKNVTLTTAQLPSHTHTFTAASHTHTFSGNTSTTSSSGAHTHSISGTTNTAGGHTHNLYSGWISETPGSIAVDALRYLQYGSNLGRRHWWTNSNLPFLQYAGAHAHSISSGSLSTADAHAHTLTPTGSLSQTSVTGSNSNTGSGQSHNNLMPYNTVSYIIKYQ